MRWDLDLTTKRSDDHQRFRRRRRPAGFEPVDPLADQIEFQRIAPGLGRGGDGDRHVGACRPARATPAATRARSRGSSASRPRRRAARRGARGGGRRSPVRGMAASTALRTRARSVSGRPWRATSGSPGSGTGPRTSISARGVAPGMALPRLLSSQISWRIRAEVIACPARSRRENMSSGMIGQLPAQTVDADRRPPCPAPAASPRRCRCA